MEKQNYENEKNRNIFKLKNIKKYFQKRNF